MVYVDFGVNVVFQELLRYLRAEDLQDDWDGGGTKSKEIGEESLIVLLKTRWRTKKDGAELLERPKFY